MRRRRRGFKQTTEQGSRYERCHFNFLIDQPSDTGGSLVNGDTVMLVGGQSLPNAGASITADFGEFGRLLQLPLRHYDVAGIVFDVTCMGDPGLSAIALTGPPAFTRLQVGWALHTQRLDAAGAPVSIPPYWESQWPVNVSNPATTAQQDYDYGTRTHVARASSISPHLHAEPISDFFTLVPGTPSRAWYSRTKLKRRIPDQYALFFTVWNRGEPFQSAFENVQWFVTGSLWYRMRW